MVAQRTPFWIAKTLSEMSQREWESLCDGCGKCCLQKLEDEDTGELYYTQIACKYLDQELCSCTVYDSRLDKVPNCVTISLDRIEEFSWLPTSCAYRMLSEGKSLADWHPLVSGSSESVHQAHCSVKGKVISEEDVPEEDWEDYLIDVVTID